ncbi:MAG: L-aspartate oxidase [Deltaproteobacteria bacterium]|nr:L-aspartate oxidase [Deltaproteobacteria bacterium]
MSQPPAYDVLVIGSGIAGLFYALSVADEARVGIITKRSAAESATSRAQGGIAAVLSHEDSFEEHVQDTLIAGAGLCNEKVVRHVVERGPKMIEALVELGVDFDSQAQESKTTDTLALGREGGHGRRRIVHHQDATGRELERVLLARAAAHPNIRLFENHCAVDVITTEKAGIDGEDRAIGAYALDTRTGKVLKILSKITLLASGGNGKVYLYTTNPDISTGDGMAMGYRAGAAIRNMEFMQFHPTCLYHPLAKSFLISEAVRGEGAILRTGDGRAFMPEYHDMADLAPRDIVARAIDTELKRSGDDSVFLDATHWSPDFAHTRFPTISERCLSFGIDITKDQIPVVPAAHYCCGGVHADLHGETSVLNLFAVGEVAHTGLHGANRLASNSLLEALVFAEAASKATRKRLGSIDVPGAQVPDWEVGEATESDEAVIITQNWDEIRHFMWNYVGIVRSDKRLERARRRIALLQDEITQYYWDFKLTTDLIELRNLALVARLIIDAAQQRQESRGLHYTVDFPERDDRYQKDTLLSRSSS